MRIIKIAVLILSCVCLTSCSCNDAKKEAKRIAKEVPKIPGYIDNIKKSKITYSKEDTDRIAKYVANGKKAKFINEMSKNIMKRKGSMEKINALFSYMDGKKIKTRYVDNTPIPSSDFNQYFYEFSNEKNHYYDFVFDFVPVDINDADNTGIKGFYMVEIEGSASARQRAIRKPVKLYRYPSEARLAKEHAAIWK